jgi:hypothetical protein
MRALSRVLGFVALPIAAWAVYGRFHGPPTLAALGHTFAASSALIVANTLLLTAILLHLYGSRDR